MTTVLHLTHTNVPRDARIQRQLVALSGLPALDVHAYGVAEGTGHPEERRYTLREFRVRSARLSRVPRPIRYTLVLAEANIRYGLSLLRLRPEIVHCHDTMVLPAGVFAKMAMRSRLIYDAHELESDKAGQSGALSKATLAIERVSWARVDHLITVSPSIADWYAEHLGRKPTTLILNSPEVQEAHEIKQGEPPNEIRRSLGLQPEVPLFVYVGALEPGRGIELLLDAFSSPNCEAHVAFVGSGGLRDEIRSAAQGNGRIHHCPPVPHDELVTFIRDATGGFCLIQDVSLSDHYCLPNKLFEYAFAGLPVIASRLPDITRLVEQYQLGQCIDLEASSVMAAVLNIASARKAPSSHALAELSWERQAEKLLALYQDLDGVHASTTGVNSPKPRGEHSASRPDGDSVDCAR